MCVCVCVLTCKWFNCYSCKCILIKETTPWILYINSYAISALQLDQNRVASIDSIRCNIEELTLSVALDFTLWYCTQGALLIRFQLSILLIISNCFSLHSFELSFGDHNQYSNKKEEDNMFYPASDVFLISLSTLSSVSPSCRYREKTRDFHDLYTLS